jgi:geranylgeranyl diphosphate synthase type 3
MVTDKTGGLFRLAVGLLQSFATTCVDVDFLPLVNNLGLYFQIRDDLINLADEEYMKSKSFCEDLTEGKFSFPIIHCIRHGGEDSSAAAQLLSILKQRTEDVDVKRYAQRLMFDAGSLRYTREKCTVLKNEIVKQIEDLGGNEPLLKVIEMLDVQVEKIAELEVGEKSGVNSPVGLKLSSGEDKGGSNSPRKNLDYT